jgi:medium-chain acyl-[acyl-carrier-protein] hydrolase
VSSLSPLARKPDPACPVRLFCFPYAGAGAALYARWPKILQHGVNVCPVELPGRGYRAREATAGDLCELARELAAELLPFLDRPFAFCGYSMGALIAFEATRALHQRGNSLPSHLFLAARAAPHLPAHPRRPRPDMPDAQLLSTLTAHYGRGIDPQLLEDAELVDYLLRVLRADLSILDRYRFESCVPLTTPVTVLGGERDSSVAAQSLTAWREHTQGEFSVHTFANRQHFFLEEEQPSICRLIEKALA